MPSECPICNLKLQSEPTPIDQSFYYECEKCGNFTLMHDANEYLRNNLCNLSSDKQKQKTTILSHYIANYNRDHKGINNLLLTTDIIEEILKKSFPTPMEQIDNLIVLLGEINKIAGEEYFIQTKEDLNRTLSFICCTDDKNFNSIKRYSKKFILESGFTGIIGLSLTLDGWEKYQELKTERKNSKKAFMAMQFSNEELTQFFKEYIQPEIKKTGFEIYKLDDNPGHGLIDDRLRVEIRNSRFLIADLTDQNNGAYWEAGYAEALGKKVFYICNKKKYNENKEATKKDGKTKSLVHFDTEHQQIYFWDKDNKDNRDDFLNDLKYSIRLAFPDAIQEDK